MRSRVIRTLAAVATLSLTPGLLNCVGVIGTVGDGLDDGTSDGGTFTTTITAGSTGTVTSTGSGTGAAGTFGSGAGADVRSQGSGGNSVGPGQGAGGGADPGGSSGGSGGGAGAPSIDAGTMSGTGGMRDAGAADRGGGDGGLVGTVAFSQISALVSRTCGPCHSNFRNYATLTTHQVSRCGSDTLVKAGDPANSAILELVQGMCGGFLMPRGCTRAPCIPNADIQLITTWINEGARNN